MSKTCGKDVYSNLNFQAQREDNMKKIEKVYNDLLGQYSTYYSEYLKAQRDAIGNPGDANAQNQKDKLTAQKRPLIKKLNQQIIDIENEILKNNKEIRKSIEEQKSAIELDLKEKATIEAKIRAIEKNLQQAEDGAYAGSQAVADTEKKTKAKSVWYYVFIAANVILFGLFLYLIFTIDYEDVESGNGNNNANTNKTNNNSIKVNNNSVKVNNNSVKVNNNNSFKVNNSIKTGNNAKVNNGMS